MISTSSDYADRALATVLGARNRLLLDSLPNAERHVVLIEQLLLTMCWRHRPGVDRTVGRDTAIEYLFPEQDGPFVAGGNVGYTHLIGRSKGNPLVAHRLVARTRHDYPDAYARIRSACT